jgi:tetratricopeptide (TPR) repeat protein/TolB-like protein
LRKKLDARTDLFSFGLVLYEMATGQQAFSGDTVSVICDAVLGLPPVPARQVSSDIPKGLERIIGKSLEKDRDLRYQSAQEMRADLMGLSVIAPRIKTRPQRTLTWVAASIGFFILGLVAFDARGIWRRIFERVPAAESSTAFKTRTSVAVLGFRNLSGKQDQAWISTALSEMLSSDLSAGQQLRVIPGEDVARMKLDLNLPAADNYNGDTLRLIRSHLGSDIVVLGSYLAMGKDAGGKVRIDLQLQDAREGETIGVIRSDGTEAELAELVSRGGAGLRQKLGVGDVTADNARQVSASVPANPEAARLYAEGLAKLHDYDALAARDLLEHAIRLDSKHALSHSALAEAWSALGYDAKAESEAKVALDLSGDLPREQRLSIEGRSHEYARDLPGAIEIYRTLRNFFPDDLDYALRLASAQTKSQLGKDALQALARARQLPKPDGDDARIDLAEAMAAESLGDFAGEQRAAAAAARRAQQGGRRLLEAQAKELEAWTWERLGDLDKATLEAREAKDLAEAVQNERLLGLTLRVLGLIDEDKGDFENARVFHKSALAILQRIGQQRQVARTLESLGNIDYEQERLADAKGYYEDALRVDREIAAPPGDIGSALGNIANVLDSSGDLVGATEMQEQSLKGFRDAGDKRGESDVLLNLGNVLVERGEMSLATQNYDQALSIAREIGYKHGESAIWHALVDVHLAQDRLPHARADAQQAIAIRQESQEQATVARSQIQLARVALEEGKAAESEQLARKAVPIFEQQKMAGDASVCTAVLARALLAESRIDDAQAAADKALVFAHQTVDRSSNFAASLAAAEVNIRRGKIEEATRGLESVRAEATRHGYRDFEFQARLKLGEIMLRSSDAANGRAQLMQLQSDALNKGFVRIAHQAQAALAS